MPESNQQPAGPANTCPACQAHIGWRGPKRGATMQGKNAQVKARCPSCGAPLRVVKRQFRVAQFVVAAIAWVCLMVAGVRGYPATSALAWLGYLGVTAALLMQVAGPRWYARDVG